ncbi:MAG: MFS transporter [Erysipelotrichaceae bacterium]
MFDKILASNHEFVEPKKFFNRDFILLWQGNAVSAFGDVLHSIAIGYWVYTQTGSTALMGLMSSISLFTNMLLRPFSGAVVDRSNRKAVIVGMDLIRGLLVVALGFLALTQNLSIIMIFITAIVMALCSVLFGPAAMTVMMDLVPKKEMLRLQSIGGATNQFISLMGQAISGSLILAFGVAPLIIANGISFILSAISEMFIRIPKGVKQGQPIKYQLIIADVVQGAKQLFASKGLSGLVIAGFLANLLSSGFLALMIPLTFAKGLSIAEYGYFTAASSGAGLCAMAILGAKPIASKHRLKAMAIAFTLPAFISAYALLYIDGFLWFTIAFCVADFLNIYANSILGAAMMTAIPRDQRATIFGFIGSFTIGGMVLSTLAYGFLAEIYPIVIITAIGGLLGLIPLTPLFTQKHFRKLIEGDA